MKLYKVKKVNCKIMLNYVEIFDIILIREDELKIIGDMI